MKIKEEESSQKHGMIKPMAKGIAGVLAAALIWCSGVGVTAEQKEEGQQGTKTSIGLVDQNAYAASYNTTFDPNITTIKGQKVTEETAGLYMENSKLTTMDGVYDYAWDHINVKNSKNLLASVDDINKYMVDFQDTFVLPAGSFATDFRGIKKLEGGDRYIKFEKDMDRRVFNELLKANGLFSSKIDLEKYKPKQEITKRGFLSTFLKQRFFDNHNINRTNELSIIGRLLSNGDLGVGSFNVQQLDITMEECLNNGIVTDASKNFIEFSIWQVMPYLFDFTNMESFKNKRIAITTTGQDTYNEKLLAVEKYKQLEDIYANMQNLIRISGYNEKVLARYGIELYNTQVRLSEAYMKGRKEIWKATDTDVQKALNEAKKGIKNTVKGVLAQAGVEVKDISDKSITISVDGQSVTVPNTVVLPEDVVAAEDNRYYQYMGVGIISQETYEETMKYQGGFRADERKEKPTKAEERKNFQAFINEPKAEMQKALANMKAEASKTKEKNITQISYQAP